LPLTFRRITAMMVMSARRVVLVVRGESTRPIVREWHAANRIHARIGLPRREIRINCPNVGKRRQEPAR
jgi:hypothetical protein